MKRMLQSSRFIAFVVSIILFVIMTFTTNYPPLELSGALSMLTAVYVGGRSFRPSEKPNNNGDI
jgi:hypothetical protein